MQVMSHDQWIGRIHMQRMWPHRHRQSAHVHANGERTDIRASIRANIRGQRSAKRYAAANPHAVRWMTV